MTVNNLLHSRDSLYRTLFRYLLAALSLAGSSTAAFGNDGYGELGMGGIVTLGKTYAVNMTKEILEVSPQKIRVDYVFERNISHPDKPIQVLFPLPLYGAETPSWSWFGAPRDFSVTVDSKHVPFKTAVRGRMGRCDDGTMSRQCGVDVTERLKATGLTDEQIALFPIASPFNDPQGKRLSVPSISDEQKHRLVREGLAEEEGPSEEHPYPKWLADVTYVWEMAFNGRQRIEVSHQYVPFTSGGSNSYYFTEDMLRNDYCADDQLVEAWKSLVAAAPTVEGAYGPVLGSRVEYILTTANSWGGSIHDFTLRLKKSKPTELVMLCFPGKIRKVAPLTLEVKLTDFEPRNELRVLFLNVDRGHGGADELPKVVVPAIVK